MQNIIFFLAYYFEDRLTPLGLQILFVLFISCGEYHVSLRQNEIRKGTDFVLVLSSETPVNQGPFVPGNTSIWRKATVSPLIRRLLSKITATSSLGSMGLSFEAHRAGLAFPGFV